MPQKIRNNGLICLKMLVPAVWIPVWMCAKQQGCEWNISVLKKSLKIGFEFRFQRVNTSCGAMFVIPKTPFWSAQLSGIFCGSCLDTCLCVCKISKHLEYNEMPAV